MWTSIETAHVILNIEFQQHCLCPSTPQETIVILFSEFVEMKNESNLLDGFCVFENESQSPAGIFERAISNLGEMVAHTKCIDTSLVIDRL